METVSLSSALIGLAAIVVVMALGLLRVHLVNKKA